MDAPRSPASASPAGHHHELSVRVRGPLVVRISQEGLPERPRLVRRPHLAQVVASNALRLPDIASR
jgi:hypothetical protein